MEWKAFLILILISSASEVVADYIIHEALKKTEILGIRFEMHCAETFR